MPLADYAHWNEDAEYMWWHEEGKHADAYEPPEPDDDDWGPGWDDAYECTDPPDECLEAGNFDQESDTHDWYCSSCGYGPFVETDNGFALKGEDGKPWPGR